MNPLLCVDDQDTEVPTSYKILNHQILLLQDLANQLISRMSFSLWGETLRLRCCFKSQTVGDNREEIEFAWVVALESVLSYRINNRHLS